MLRFACARFTTAKERGLSAAWIQMDLSSNSSPSNNKDDSGKREEEEQDEIRDRLYRSGLMGLWSAAETAAGTRVDELGERSAEEELFGIAMTLERGGSVTDVSRLQPWWTLVTSPQTLHVSEPTGKPPRGVPDHYTEYDFVPEAAAKALDATRRWAWLASVPVKFSRMNCPYPELRDAQVPITVDVEQVEALSRMVAQTRVQGAIDDMEASAGDVYEQSSVASKSLLGLLDEGMKPKDGEMESPPGVLPGATGVPATWFEHAGDSGVIDDGRDDGEETGSTKSPILSDEKTGSRVGVNLAALQNTPLDKSTRARVAELFEGPEGEQFRAQLRELHEVLTEAGDQSLEIPAGMDDMSFGEVEKKGNDMQKAAAMPGGVLARMAKVSQTIGADPVLLTKFQKLSSILGSNATVSSQMQEIQETIAEDPPPVTKMPLKPVSADAAAGASRELAPVGSGLVGVSAEKALDLVESGEWTGRELVQGGLDWYMGKGGVDGDEQRDDVAVKMWRAGATLSSGPSPVAAFNLGNAYRVGRVPVALDLPSGVRLSDSASDNDYAATWYRLGAREGHSEAAYNLGLLHYYEKLSGFTKEVNDEAAVRWLKKASDGGVEGASWLLSYMYEQGIGVVGPSYDLALKYAHRLSEWDWIRARFIELRTGKLVSPWIEVTREVTEGYWEMLAMRGDPRAQLYCGIWALRATPRANNRRGIAMLIASATSGFAPALQVLNDLARRCRESGWGPEWEVDSGDDPDADVAELLAYQWQLATDAHERLSDALAGVPAEEQESEALGMKF